MTDIPQESNTTLSLPILDDPSAGQLSDAAKAFRVPSGTLGKTTYSFATTSEASVSVQTVAKKPAVSPAPLYDDIEIIQVFPRGLGLEDNRTSQAPKVPGSLDESFVIYQTRNTKTGAWEVRLRSGGEKVFDDLLAFESDRKVTREDFGRDGPVWKAVRQTEDLLAQPENVLPKREGFGSLDDFQTGVTLGSLTNLFGTFAALPEAVARGLYNSGQELVGLGQRLANWVLPGDQTKTGPGNPLEAEQNWIDAQTNKTLKAVKNVERDIASWLNADVDSPSYQAGAILGGFLMATSRDPGKYGERAPSLPTQIGPDDLPQLIEKASPDQLVQGLGRVSDVDLAAGLAANPAIGNALRARASQFSASSPQTAYITGRLDAAAKIKVGTSPRPVTQVGDPALLAGSGDLVPINLDPVNSPVNDAITRTSGDFVFMPPGTAAAWRSSQPELRQDLVASGMDGSNAGIRLNGQSSNQPVPLTEPQKAIRNLAVDTFEMNINPSVRRIVNDIKSGVAPIEHYDATLGDPQTIALVDEVLTQAGVTNAPNAASDIVTIAKGIDVDAVDFADRLISDITTVRQTTQSYNAQNPVIVNTALDPGSLNRANDFVSALFSDGVHVPGSTKLLEIDGVQYEVLGSPSVVTTTNINDIDGVMAPSYGVNGIDLKIDSRDGQTGHVFLLLDEPLPGNITRVEGVSLTPRSREVVIQVETPDGPDRISVPLTEDEAEILMGARNVETRGVEGLGARYFPAESVSFLRQASDNNARVGDETGGVVQPTIILNTFGTVGNTAFQGSPAQLATSVARSLPPGDTIEPLPAGLYAIDQLPTYSGGSAKTLGDLIMQPFGLSQQQAQGLQNVAVAIPSLVDDLSTRYGLSDAATEAWEDAIFANPDIPSVILPGSVVEELRSRTPETHPGRTLRALQDDIETSLQGLLERNDLGQIVTLHHTPTGEATATNPDTVAPYESGYTPENTPDFTTEWQFAVNGQKALPVLDVMVNYFAQHHNIDLKAELSAAGHSYGSIRRLNLEETMAFFRDEVRPIIDGLEASEGRPLTGKIVVAADTYLEKDGRLSGSDASMIRAAQALYGEENVVIVQVDTFGGQPPVDAEGRPIPGRSQRFSTQINEQTGELEIARPSVDPNGDNASSAPTIYLTTQQEFGAIFDEALKEQGALTREELQVRPE